MRGAINILRRLAVARPDEPEQWARGYAAAMRIAIRCISAETRRQLPDVVATLRAAADALDDPRLAARCRAAANTMEEEVTI